MEYRTLVVQRFATWPFTFLPWIQMHNHMAILSCMVWNSLNLLHYSMQSAQEKLLIVATQLLSSTKSYTFDANPVYHRNQSIWKTAAKAYQCKVLGSFLLTTQQRAIIRWTWEIPSSRADAHTEKVPLQNPYSAGIFFGQAIQPEFQTISLPSLKLNQLAKEICSKEANSWKIPTVLGTALPKRPITTRPGTHQIKSFKITLIWGLRILASIFNNLM
jgi:hypothetical protein